MNTDAEREILEEALMDYGAEAQTLRAFEEMAELQKELCKLPRVENQRQRGRSGRREHLR